MKLIPSEFSLCDRKTYKGFSYGETWNGFACPFFIKDVAEEICADVSTNGCVLSWDSLRGCFIETTNEGEAVFEQTDIELNGEIVTIYGIGTYAYTWWNEHWNNN